MYRLAVCVLAAVVLCTESARLSSPHFDAFVKMHGRKYETEVEHNIRYSIFYQNMAKWELMNKLERGTATYGMNEFSDLSEEEFTALYLSPTLTQSDREAFDLIPEAEGLDVSAAPAEMDWRKHNAVSPIKHQGSCGSCWAFSTTGNIEGRFAIKNGTLVALSEQELVDCDKVDFGCSGGLPMQAVEEVKRLGGLVREDDYPYWNIQDTCKLERMRSKIVVQVAGVERVSTDEAEIAAYVAANGPVSVGVNAAAMQSYLGGVSYPWFFSCNPFGINHAVLIVGYGIQDGEPYWLIKNSWGTGWGERGYYKLHRGAGSCGVNMMVSSAIL